MYSTLQEQKYFMSLQEAIVVLEVFITSIKNITRARDRALVTEEIEIKREFTFNVAVAFEEFALNYSKLHLIGTRSSQVIDNHIMGESEHNMVSRPWWCSKFVHVTEWEALFLDQIDSSGPPIDYLCLSIVIELNNYIQRFYRWFYNLLRIAFVVR